MAPPVIDLTQFLEVRGGESYYKGYMIPGKPNWARIMISKQRADGLVEAANFVVFTDNSGSLLWEKPTLRKIQSPEDFERELAEFRRMIEGAGLLIFIHDYRGDAAEDGR